MPIDVDLPTVVAKQSFLAQTNNFASVVIFTPSVSGLYRISVYLECATTADIDVNVQFTDDRSNAQDAEILSINVGKYSATTAAGNSLTGVACFRATSGNAISVSTNDYAGTGTYDLYVVIEQLW
jgi:hypothetical protein